MHQGVCKCAGKCHFNTRASLPLPAASSWLQNEHLPSQDGAEHSAGKREQCFPAWCWQPVALCPAALWSLSASSSPLPCDIPFPVGGKNRSLPVLQPCALCHGQEQCPMPWCRRRLPNPFADARWLKGGDKGGKKLFYVLITCQLICSRTTLGAHEELLN